MQKVPSLFFVGKKELLSFSSLLWIVCIAILYLFFLLILLNYRLSFATLSSPIALTNKLIFFASLFLGLFTAFSWQDTTITVLSAFLVGTNVVLIAKSLYLLERTGKMKVSIGGATLIGLISTGCSSCGFSLLSILGISTSLSFLPFHGMELHLLSLFFLIFSSWYMLKKLRDGGYCKR